MTRSTRNRNRGVRRNPFNNRQISGMINKQRRGANRQQNQSARGRIQHQKGGGDFQHQNGGTPKQTQKKKNVGSKNQNRFGLPLKESDETKQLLKGKKDYLYYCKFCKIDSISSEDCFNHLASLGHRETLEKEQKASETKMDKLQLEAHNKCTEAKKANLPIDICLECLLQFSGSEEDHLKSSAHKEMMEEMQVYCDICDYYHYTRYEYEKHRLSVQHTRKLAYKMIEEGTINEQRLLLCPEKYDANVEVGCDYVRDERMYHCVPCDEKFPCRKGKEDTFSEHCKSEAHFYKFKQYCQEMKAKKNKNEELEDGEIENGDKEEVEEMEDKEVDEKEVSPEKEPGKDVEVATETKQKDEKLKPKATPKARVKKPVAKQTPTKRQQTDEPAESVEMTAEFKKPAPKRAKRGRQN